MNFWKAEIVHVTVSVSPLTGDRDPFARGVGKESPRGEKVVVTDDFRSRRCEATMDQSVRVRLVRDSEAEGDRLLVFGELDRRELDIREVEGSKDIQQYNVFLCSPASPASLLASASLHLLLILRIKTFQFTKNSSNNSHRTDPTPSTIISEEEVDYCRLVRQRKEFARGDREYR